MDIHSLAQLTSVSASLYLCVQCPSLDNAEKKCALATMVDLELYPWQQFIVHWWCKHFAAVCSTFWLPAGVDSTEQDRAEMDSMRLDSQPNAAQQSTDGLSGSMDVVPATPMASSQTVMAVDEEMREHIQVCTAMLQSAICTCVYQVYAMPFCWYDTTQVAPVYGASASYTCLPARFGNGPMYCVFNFSWVSPA